MRSHVHINEVAINQGQQTPQDALALGDSVISVTIRNSFDSTQNMQIGWNSGSPNSGNTLQPGSSITYEQDGFDLVTNKLYIGWEGSSGGKGLVTIMNEVCP